MNLLILQPSLKKFKYNLFSCNEKETILSAEVDGFCGMASEKNEWTDSLMNIKQNCQKAQSDNKTGSIVLTIPFGGDVFDKPVLADSDTIEKLQTLIPQAPLHLPGTLQLITCCNEVFPKLPVILIFETSFFTTMPEREYTYAISPDIMKKMNIKRYGLNGIYHEAASLMASRELRKRSKTAAPRIISICLEAQPEVAAVKGQRVLMVTKAIPGETVCGQIDPNIVLTLSEMVKWGPEKINKVLMKQSGLLGLTGKNITMEEVFTNDDPNLFLAQQICQYRLLNACGAAVAAMGGVDAIVFSGRFTKLDNILKLYLTEKLRPALAPQENFSVCSFNESKETAIFNLVSNMISSIHSCT